jgi:hypothetical protein
MWMSAAVPLLNVLAQDVSPRPDTLRIDPSVPAPDGQHPDVEGIPRRSADTIFFVRCDTPIPDGKGQAMFDAIRARVLGMQ